jgi:hypothetical protein
MKVLQLDSCLDVGSFSGVLMHLSTAAGHMSRRWVAAIAARVTLRFTPPKAA